MRTFNMLATSVVASLVFSALANASEPSVASDNGARNSQVLQRPALPWNLPANHEMSPPSAKGDPVLHWTAAFGTGKAAALESGADSAPPASTPAEAHWSSAIGTGTGAAHEQVST
jgi:hypothetical protein